MTLDPRSQPPRPLLCEEAKALMGEALSEFPVTPNTELTRHLDGCPACRATYEALHLTLTELKAVPFSVAEPPAHLLDRLEQAISVTPQDKPDKLVAPSLQRNNLLAQYVYLVVLGISLMSALAFGQPVLQEALAARGLTTGNWLLDEYSLFILFFSLGGFVSIIAAPILVNNQGEGSGQMSWWRRLLRVFPSTLRLFAC